MDVALSKLRKDLLALPTAQRAYLAQELWGSLEADSPDSEESEILDEAERRHQEMVSGRVVGRTHDEVMATLRKRLQS